jgi:uncharacterized LabA/DUF88 family protein
MPDSNTAIRKTLYVDASNLYGGLSELLKPGEYVDFSTLLPIIDAAFGGVDKIKVYGAYMGLSGVTSPSRILFIKAQNEFFNSTRLTGVYFGRGSISAHGKEKGVDMQIGVDMVNDAYQDDYEDAILLSGDADFMYPISIIKDMGKNFHHCSFATRYTQHLAYQGWRKVVLDYNNYFATKVQPTLKRAPKKLQVIDIDNEVAVQSV